VVVTTPAPGGGASATLTFTVNNPAPVLSSISPSTVTVGSGAFSLAATGSSFVQGSVVQVDGSARTTHFVNSTQITADLLAGDDSATGTHTITVFNPTPGGGTSGGTTLTVASQPNPVPVLSTLSPCGKVAGAAAFTLTINGASFVPGATATFNGAAVPVTFVSASQVTAAIPQSSVATAPSNDSVQVVVSNPSPGGGASGPAYFGIASKVSTLSGNVQNLFTLNCATGSCHVTGSTTAPMSLESGKSFAALVGVISSEIGCAPTLRVLSCGALRSQSTLIDKIYASASSPACSGNPMPKGAPLTATELKTILDWVAQGAPP
jgi:hypothetical protein